VAQTIAEAETTDKWDQRFVGVNTQEAGPKNPYCQAHFLRWAWPQVKNIEFLTLLIVDFCAENENKLIVQRAWLVMPQDLEDAMTRGSIFFLNPHSHASGRGQTYCYNEDSSSLNLYWSQ
jgi:hypothetical protein